MDPRPSASKTPKQWPPPPGCATYGSFEPVTKRHALLYRRAPRLLVQVGALIGFIGLFMAAIASICASCGTCNNKKADPGTEMTTVATTATPAAVAVAVPVATAEA